MHKIFLFFIIFSSFSLSLIAQKLEAGADSRNITPNPLLPVSGGTGAPGIATVMKGELTTRALVIRKGNIKIAIVAIDNLGVPKVVGDRIRALIPQIKPENIIIGATHTHSAPDLYGFADEKGNSSTELNYIDLVIKKTAEAINEACKNAKPAMLKVAMDEAKGKIAYNYYAPDLYDPRVSVLQLISEKNNKAIATLVNYATHPEIIGSDRGICTPDLIGPLYNRIKEKNGGMGIFMNSAQGGMVTADNRREGGKEANDWNECIRIGELLADESLRIIKEAPVEKNPDISILSKEVKFPVESDLMSFILKNAKLKYHVDQNNMITTRMNLINIGKAKIITIPGEALPNIGFYIKRKMNTDYPFLFGLTNDAFGYIITKEDFNGFKRYSYICRTSLGEKTAEILEDAALDLVKESKELYNR